MGTADSVAPGRRHRKKGTNSRRVGGLTLVEKWWTAVGHLVKVQLACSLLMQLSYVAFPAYNFALALWCLVGCTPAWSARHARLLPLHMGAVGFSVITDIIWMSLWVSGRVFYDQFCGANAVSIVSCGGASDRFPGCSTNQFALFALVMNLLAKSGTVLSMHHIQTLKTAGRSKHRNPPSPDGEVNGAPGASADAEVQPLPSDVMLTTGPIGDSTAPAVPETSI